ncbi:LysR family transcriptional regulator [Roseovarius sp. 22II1-1F6A]|nr:LysR family transcriptional regulator [Roseovarius sp. 22II1-1F6A]
MSETPGRVTLWGIEVFLATAEEGAISAAARRLGASPSGVSQQITGLEAALGCTLIDRSTRPLTLTPAGRTFLRRATRIRHEAAQAQAELAAHDLSHLRSFRLGMIEDLDADVTPALLSLMAEELKSCQFLLETGASHRLTDHLEHRTLDVIVAADTGQRANWMETHPLLEEPYVIAMPRGRVTTPAALEPALRELPLIQYTQRHMMGRQIHAHLLAQELRPSGRFELDSYHAIMAMVARGTGWTILTPLGLARAHRFRDEADVFPLPFAPLSRRITLSARAGVLQDMPRQVATRMRGLLADMVVQPTIARLPWLDGQLRVL